MSPPLRLGRRSLHHFDDPEEEASTLIYSYTPVYAGNFTSYQQIYFFWAPVRVDDATRSLWSNILWHIDVFKVTARVMLDHFIWAPRFTLFFKSQGFVSIYMKRNGIEYFMG